MINKSSMKHENEKDSIIKSELHFYMSMLKKSKKDLEKVTNPCTDVSVGDIIVLSTPLFVPIAKVTDQFESS